MVGYDLIFQQFDPLNIVFLLSLKLPLVRRNYSTSRLHP